MTNTALSPESHKHQAICSDPAIIGAVVILAYNNASMTANCLSSVKNQYLTSDQRILTVIIDNASTDSTSKLIRYLQPDSDYLMATHFNQQQSVAHCWNYALDYIFGVLKLPLALVLNNDTEISKYTFRTLHDLMTCKEPVLNYPPVSQRQFLTCNSTPDRRVFQQTQDCLPDPSPHPDFSAFMIRADCYRTVGKFDESFQVAYGEDCDYHARMHAHGIRALNTGLIYLHHASAALKDADESSRERISKQADLNRAYFHKKWGRYVGTEGYNDLFTDEKFGCLLR